MICNNCKLSIIDGQQTKLSFGFFGYVIHRQCPPQPPKRYIVRQGDNGDRDWPIADAYEGSIVLIIEQHEDISYVRWKEDPSFTFWIPTARLQEMEKPS